jgi:hypothetical protein
MSRFSPAPHGARLYRTQLHIHRMQFQSARDGHDVLMPVKRHDVAFFTGTAWTRLYRTQLHIHRMQFNPRVTDTTS